MKTILITNTIPITLITYENDIDYEYDTDNVNNIRKRY